MCFLKKKPCVAAVIPAAGSASRMRGIDKLFYELDGVPVIIHTLRRFEEHPEICEIVLPTRADSIGMLKELCERYGITKASKIIEGGATRTESVLCGVRAVSKSCKIVAIHDAARPFVSDRIITETIAAAKKCSAAAPGVPIVDTVKRKNGDKFSETVPRDELTAIQTPQIFDRELILGALSNAIQKNLAITDDCSALEAIGMPIALTEGDPFNRKITTPEDLIFAQAILGRESE